MKEDITQALINLHEKTGKEWINLNSIYEEVEKIRGVPNANKGASIRRTLQTYTKGFDTFKGEELYISYKKGSGLYKSCMYETTKSINDINIDEEFQDNKVNEITNRIIEIENNLLSEIILEPKELKYIEGPINIRKYKKSNKHTKRSKKPDFIAQEIIKNKQGIINEKYIYEIEKSRLLNEDSHEQIKLMEDFFNNKKENEGFDILSFEKKENGEYIEKYIEVKSTKGDESTPIDITIDEIEFAKLHLDNYYLYRIINSDGNNRYLKIVKAKDLLENYEFIPTVFKIYSK